MLTIDQAMEICGNNGKYQIRLFIISSFLTLLLSLQIMSPTYNYIIPQLYCDGQICEDTQEVCDNKNYIIDPQFKYINIVTEFYLFCNHKKFIMITQTINFLGSMIGGSILCHLSDIWGRCNTLLFSLFFTNFSLIGIYFSYNIYYLIFFTFLYGFFQVGVYIVIPVIINEVSGYEIKQIYSTGTLIFWCIGEIIIAIAFYTIPDWRTIQLFFIVIPGIISFIFAYFIIQESPRYLYQMNKFEEATNQIRKIAQINGKYFNQNLTQQYETKSQRTTYSILDLFKIKKFSSTSIGFILISFALHLIYYGGQFVIQDIAFGNMIYKLGIVLGLSELMGYSFTTYFIPKLARRFSQIVFFCLQIFGCFSFLWYGFTQYSVECESCTQEYFSILLCIMIRFFNSFGFGLLRQHSLEFYPTAIRGTGSGFLFTMGIFGSFCSSYVIALANFLKINQIAFIGFCSTSGILGATLTKETYQRNLIDDIDQQESVLNDEIISS